MSSKQSIVFRPVHKNDVDQLIILLTEEPDGFFHPHQTDRKTILDICTTGTDHYYVLILHKKLIGYSLLRLFGTQIPSYGCYIAKEHRGQGYGSLLTECTIDAARQLGYTRMMLRVNQMNTTAYQLYLKHGFHPKEDQMVVMEREL